MLPPSLGAWRLSSVVVPRCIYTEPELASVGATRGGDEEEEEGVVEYVTPLAGNDRAILEALGR
jgi:pyruvate/2-oxoglutarate dehydrogenase complex dihydrolipoamide dehydrogenase (E3) component